MTFRQWTLVSAALFLLASCASVPRPSGRHGAVIDVSLRDGRTFSGELIAVRSGSLFILTPAGRDQTLALSDCTAVRVRNSSRVLPRSGHGLLIGFMVGIVLPHLASDPHIQNYSNGLIVAGAVTGLMVGGISGIPAPGKTLVIGPGPDACSVDSAADELCAVARFPSER